MASNTPNTCMFISPDYLTSEIDTPDMVVGCEKLLQLRFISAGSLAAVELDEDDKN